MEKLIEKYYGDLIIHGHTEEEISHKFKLLRKPCGTILNRYGGKITVEADESINACSK